MLDPLESDIAFLLSGCRAYRLAEAYIADSQAVDSILISERSY